MYRHAYRVSITRRFVLVGYIMSVFRVVRMAWNLKAYSGLRLTGLIGFTV